MSDILAIAFEGHPIRTTAETPKRVSVLDVLAAVGYSKPHDALARIRENHPDVLQPSGRLQFPGQGQRPTPVIDKQGVLSLVMVLQGPKAAAFREWASSILVRYLDGDKTLAQEIHLRADLDDEYETFAPATADEIFEEAAPAVMMALSEKASRGSIQAARLLLQYHATIKGPATVAEARPTPASKPLLDASESWESLLTPMQRFWYDCLRTGEITAKHGFGDEIPTRDAIRAYVRSVDLPINSRAIESTFGIQLRKLCPSVKRSRSDIGTERLWCYRFPTLTECRRLFCVSLNVRVQWEVSNG